MRTGKIDFSVEKSTRSLMGTITSGEGLLQTSGDGIGVAGPDPGDLLALRAGGMASLAAAMRTSNTGT